MIYTGERFVPQEKSDSLMALEHMHRYFYVLPYVTQKKCLDIACGEGYGSALLARSASEVIGCDVDPEAVLWAEKQYQRKNVFFQQADIVKLPFEDKVFDIITCFETIEHVSQDAQKEALCEFKRVLKDNGLLFISTPNRDSPLYIKNNKYHKHEMSNEEFNKELSAHFDHIICLGQSIYCSSIISAQGNDGKIENSFTEDDLMIPNNKYIMAVCSNFSLPEIPKMSFYTDTSNAFFRQLTKIRNTIGWGIPIWNLGIQILSYLIPFKNIKHKIRLLKW